MKSSLKKTNMEFEIVKFDDEKKFTVKKKDEKIVFYDEKLITEVIDQKFNKSYKQLLYIITDITSNDDATDTDAFLVRDRIEELRSMLLNKYAKHLSKDLLNKYLKMLLILDSKLIFRKEPELEMEGRGR